MPALKIKDAQAVLVEPLFYLINQFVTDENFGVYQKKIIELLFSKKKIPKNHLIQSLLLSQKSLKSLHLKRTDFSEAGTPGCETVWLPKINVNN